MTNGTVYGLARAGAYVYAAGQFTKELEHPPGQAGGTFNSAGIARFDAVTGVVDKTWKVTVTNADGTRPTVRTIAVAGGNVYFGGTFDQVDGQPRSNIASVSEADGSLNSFAPVVNKTVMSMITDGSTVYVGGAFTTIDGAGRSRLAAFSSSGSLLSSWRPRASSEVRALIFGCGDNTVWAGGRFGTIAGTGGTFQTRTLVAQLDATTGALEPWANIPADVSGGANAFDLAISCASNEIFVGIGGTNLLYAFDTSDNVGDLLWTVKSSGNVQTVAFNDKGTADPSDDDVYYGGHFGGGVQYDTSLCDPFKPKQIRFAETRPDGHCDLSWMPTFDGKFYGPWDILVTDGGKTVWVGGQYTIVCDGNTSACASQYFLSRFSDV
jgi:hypothetical protein